jgi:ssDNA-specific exonuclease RecJ
MYRYQIYIHNTIQLQKELLRLFKSTFCSNSSLGKVVKVKDELGFVKTVISLLTVSSKGRKRLWLTQI